MTARDGEGGRTEGEGARRALAGPLSAPLAFLSRLLPLRFSDAGRGGRCRGGDGSCRGRPLDGAGGRGGTDGGGQGAEGLGGAAGGVQVVKRVVRDNWKKRKCFVGFPGETVKLCN